MKFRTEIEPVKTGHEIHHGDSVLLLGSCFTDNIGERLAIDGFNAVYNPLGPLYNPLSIARCLKAALSHKRYDATDLTAGPRGSHCLDYASRYSGEDRESLLKKINEDFVRVTGAVENLHTLIVTFGSAFVFERGGTVVGNCHKFPAKEFDRRRVDVDEIVTVWAELIDSLPDKVRIIFTVSPIRHLADGLHGNQLSKATLLLAIDRLRSLYPDKTLYFPSYEIMLDDLRDYRFYAADMKHPSDVAADYIYEIFCGSYMTTATRDEALECRRRYRASQHRQIL